MQVGDNLVIVNLYKFNSFINDAKYQQLRAHR
jgi:hypothetical protein